MIPIRAAIVVCFAASLNASCQPSRVAGTATSTRISGRIVFPDGRPWSSVYVNIARVVPEGLAQEEQVTTDANGMFTFQAATGKTYRVYLNVYGVTGRKTVETAGSDYVALGEIVAVRCAPADSVTFAGAVANEAQQAQLRVDQIVLEPQPLRDGEWQIIPATSPEQDRAARSRAGFDPDAFPEVPPCWSRPLIESRPYWGAYPMLWFDERLTIGSFIGGKVKSVQISRYDPRLEPDEIKNQVRRVWRGTLSHASRIIDWSEGTPWNIEAIAEDEDGTRSSLLIDRWDHVRVTDRHGRNWYTKVAVR
jgi:hypothetical protein